MDRRLYACAVVAVHLASGTIKQAVASCVTRSSEVAKTLMMEEAMRVFSEAEGYSLHTVAVNPVPAEWYELTWRTADNGG